MFFQSYAKFTYRFRWFIIAFWILATVASVMWLPNLDQVVAHKSTHFLPDSSKPIQAQHLLEKINPDAKSKSSAVIAIYQPNGLQQTDLDYFKKVLEQINQNKSKVGIISVEDAYHVDASAASAFESKDKTTMIAVAGFPTTVETDQTKEAIAQLQKAFTSPPQGAKVLFTGDAPIQQDDIRISSQGADKTAVVTVVLVLVILLIVFRSIMAPLVTLFTIGMSFMMTSNLVAWFAEHGMPVSTFTRMFIIAILFGAGTDYCLILLMRFREELTKSHANKIEALEASLRGISKTVIYSGFTVLVSFAVLYFANFGLYRSAVGVSVGVAITLLACLTFVPAILSVFGGALFWPRRPAKGDVHPPSRFWSFTGKIATNRPWWTSLALIAVLLPIALSFTNQRNFDPMADIPNAPSVQGFQTLAQSFGPGEVMPVDLVLHTDQNLRSATGLTTIANISKALSALSGVKQVNSATRPTGETIKGFQIANQNQQAADGLNQVNQGLNTLASNLNDAASKVSQIPQGAEKLAQGSKQVTSGAAQLQQGLNQVTSNTSKLVDGANQLQTGAAKLQGSLNQVKDSLQQTQLGATQLHQGLQKTAVAVKSIAEGSNQLSSSEQQLSDVASKLSNAIAGWAKAHPNVQSDPQWKQIEALAQMEQSGQLKAETGVKQVATGASQIDQAMPSLVSGASKLDDATGKLAEGVGQLANGSAGLSTGAGQLSSGVTALATGVSKLSDGAVQLHQGSDQVTVGIQTFASSLSTLSSGLTDAGKGANKLGTGVSEVQKYLKDTQTAGTQGDPGFYVPQGEVTSNKDLGKSLDAYISPDGHIAKFTVILAENPYSSKALNSIQTIEQAAKFALLHSPIHSGDILSGGTTAIQHEMSQISNRDFVRSIALILIAIFILLVLMLRSIITPLYIILSLGATYFITMGIMQIIFVDILHHKGLSWSAPFFVFLLLVALGVDYCIFLMSRFEEEYLKGISPKQAIYDAMRRMGGVIFSAAAIMGGTFGSMSVSGVGTLIQIGVAIIIGLFIYSFIILGFFIPASATILGKAHGWPFDSTLVDKEPVIDVKSETV